MSIYRRFIERNDHEGEIWNWWLEEEGNGVPLEQLRIRLEHADPAGEMFELTHERLIEEDVDLLARFAGDGYFPAHNKVTGTLQLNLLYDDELIDTLYKGGIRDLFK